jgi:Flp pilus assembly protein TadD
MDLLLARGREALEGEEYEKALDHFTALVDLDPDFAEGWNARATAWYLKDEYWRAVADIQRAIELEPRHFGALSGLGVILERIGDTEGALRAYRAAIDLNPHLETAQKAVERLAPKVDGRDI